MGSDNNKTYTLVTDGGSRGNPGPSAIAAIIRDRDGQVVEKTSEYIGVATNNEAEYRALLMGLQIAQKRGIRNLEHVSDSKLVVSQMSGEWRVRHPNVVPLNKKAKKLWKSFESVHHRWVPREDESIMVVDRLVNDELDRNLQASPN